MVLRKSTWSSTLAALPLPGVSSPTPARVAVPYFGNDRYLRAIRLAGVDGAKSVSVLEALKRSSRGNTPRGGCM
jgi:hypothetical protein